MQQRSCCETKRFAAGALLLCEQTPEAVAKREEDGGAEENFCLHEAQRDEVEGDDHEGDGIDEAEDWRRKADDGVEADDGDEKAPDGEYDQPAIEAEGTEILREIFGAAGEEADADVEAGEEKDRSEHDRSEPPEENAAEGAEDVRAVAGGVHRGAAVGTHEGEDAVDEREHGAGDEASADGGGGDELVVRDAEGADVEGDDDAEDHGGEGVHGLVAVDKSCRQRAGSVAFCWCAAGELRMEETGDEHGSDEKEQHRRHAFAEHVLELFRIACQKPGGEKKERGKSDGEHELHRKPEDRPVASALGDEAEHGVARAGCARDRQERSDADVDDQRENAAEERMDLFAEFVDAADACRSDDAEHWKNNGRDDEADERWQRVRAGLKAEKRREDEISRTEKHGE